MIFPRTLPPHVLAGGLVLLAAWAGAAGPAAPAPPPPALFKDTPPGRVTGGFGEESCVACHWNGPENDDKGTLSISGFPARFSPGDTYPLELALARPGMAVAGFQLAVRHAADGTMAGSLAVSPDEKGRVGILRERDVEFAHHLPAGIALAAPDTGRWTVLWTAPSSGNGVLLHASAVAGDGDESQIGDHVYTVELETRVR